jgi:hypothetical protein
VGVAIATILTACISVSRSHSRTSREDVSMGPPRMSYETVLSDRSVSREGVRRARSSSREGVSRGTTRTYNTFNTSYAATRTTKVRI